MGQKLSCVQQPHEHGLFSAVQNGELEKVEAMINEDPNVLHITSVRGKLSALHVAAANAQIEVGFSFSWKKNAIFISYPVPVLV